jgi:hypothetical protein
MPMMIEHIDAIARRKQRDVLYLTFIDPNTQSDPALGMTEPTEIAWQTLPIRQTIINWLDEQQISWCPCMHVASVNLIMSYRGQIYIDVVYDTELPIYQTLANYLELPDGTMKFREVEFWLLPLNIAMKNAEHDEPGFWERWAEKF